MVPTMLLFEFRFRKKCLLNGKCRSDIRLHILGSLILIYTVRKMSLVVLCRLKVKCTHDRSGRLDGTCSVCDSYPVAVNCLSGDFSPLISDVYEKSIQWFRKESCVVSTGVKSQETHICVIDRHDMTSAVKMALNSSTNKRKHCS